MSVVITEELVLSIPGKILLQSVQKNYKKKKKVKEEGVGVRELLVEMCCCHGFKECIGQSRMENDILSIEYVWGRLGGSLTDAVKVFCRENSMCCIIDIKNLLERVG